MCTEYERWTRRHWESLRDRGPRLVALLTGAPLEWADRWLVEQQRRHRIARAMGGAHAFYVPGDLTRPDGGDQ